MSNTLVVKATLARWDTTDILMNFAVYLDTDLDDTTGVQPGNNYTGGAPHPAVSTEYVVTIYSYLFGGYLPLWARDFFWSMGHRKLRR